MRLPATRLMSSIHLVGVFPYCANPPFYHLGTPKSIGRSNYLPRTLPLQLCDPLSYVGCFVHLRISSFLIWLCRETPSIALSMARWVILSHLMRLIDNNQVSAPYVITDYYQALLKYLGLLALRKTGQKDISEFPECCPAELDSVTGWDWIWLFRHDFRLAHVYF